MKAIFILSSAALMLTLSACTHADAAHKHLKPQSQAQSEEHEHPEFMASVKSYHDVMSKDWHADAGPERIASTCSNIRQYCMRANAITKTSAPASTTQSAWDDAAKGLVDATKALQATCGTTSKASFEGDFSNVHDKFHSLIELLPQKTEEQ